MAELITRALTVADLEVRGDGRTVYGVVVPFDRETVITTRGEKYREVFRAGAFTPSINAGVNRVKLFVNHNHLRGDEPVGVATMLREDKKELVGEFRIASTSDGDAALQKVADGVFDAFSVGFSEVPGKTTRAKDLVERREVKLIEVSLVSYPAYADAAISGVRAAFPELTDEVLSRMLALADNEVLERLLALAESDTHRSEPAVGTSDVDSSATPDDPAVRHSSTETGTDEEPTPIDTSYAARQQRARQIDARWRLKGAFQWLTPPTSTTRATRASSSSATRRNASTTKSSSSRRSPFSTRPRRSVTRICAPSVT